MKRLFARVRCTLWYWLGLFAHHVMVQPIPDAIWHLQRPGAALYQIAMGRSYLLSEKHNLGDWQSESEEAKHG